VELEQAFAKQGQGLPITPVLGLKLMQEVDHGCAAVVGAACGR
jgi:hypothetical protein